jgi:hypothetical protein
LDSTLYIEERYKFNLNFDYRDPYGRSIGHGKARVCLRDYLSLLYRWLQVSLAEGYTDYNEMNVQYCFSIPTSWARNSMIDLFRSVITKAGFGQGRNPFETILFLEADAVASYALGETWALQDLFVVCNAGALYTDVNVFKRTGVKDAGTGPRIPLVCSSEDPTIGMNFIDSAAEEYIADSLEEIRNLLPEGPSVVAKKMVEDRFQNWKRTLGSDFKPTTASLPVLELPLDRYAHRGSVSGSSLVVHEGHLRGLFDKQIRRLTSLVDDQLRHLGSRDPKASVVSTSLIVRPSHTC